MAPGLARGLLGRQVEDATAAQDGDAQLLARSEGADGPHGGRDVAGRVDRDVPDLEDDVSADDRLLTVDEPQLVPAAQAEVGGDRALDDLLDEETSALLDSER